METDVQIRLATPDDIARMQEVEQSASVMFADTPFPNVVTMPGQQADYLAEEIADERVWVAVWDDQVVGFTIATLVDGAAHVHELSVDPAFGRRGIGTKLVETVIDWAACNGDETITLSTFRDIPWNGPYYRKLGFSIIDEADLTDDLRDVREHEAQIGLQVDQRVLMRRTI